MASRKQQPNNAAISNIVQGASPLLNAINDKDPVKIENAVEQHPQESKEALDQIAPEAEITEEAHQITDDTDKRNNEVNNEALEKSDIDSLYDRLNNFNEDTDDIGILTGKPSLATDYWDKMREDTPEREINWDHPDVQAAKEGMGLSTPSDEIESDETIAINDGYGDEPIPDALSNEELAELEMKADEQPIEQQQPEIQEAATEALNEVAAEEEQVEENEKEETDEAGVPLSLRRNSKAWHGVGTANSNVVPKNKLEMDTGSGNTMARLGRPPSAGIKGMASSGAIKATPVSAKHTTSANQPGTSSKSGGGQGGIVPAQASNTPTARMKIKPGLGDTPHMNGTMGSGAGGGLGNLGKRRNYDLKGQASAPEIGNLIGSEAAGPLIVPEIMNAIQTNSGVSSNNSELIAKLLEILQKNPELAKQLLEQLGGE